MNLSYCVVAGLLGGTTLATAAVEPLYVVLTPENPLHATPRIVVPPEQVIPRLRPEHPRLLLTRAGLSELRSKHAADPVFQGYVAAVIKQADGLRKAPVTEKERECLNRVFTLGFAYHWTGDRSYREPVIRDLLALCAKRDWNWGHFLTTAETALAVGLGYDWFFDVMDEPTRATIREGLITNGLIPGMAAYQGAPYGWFHRVRHNWNQVCNSGLIVAALAIAETDPDYARLIVPEAVRSLALAMNEYALDGAYPEGPGYNGFGTGAAMQGLSALQTALGTDFGLSEVPGFSQNCYYRLYVRGPTGLSMGYADASPKAPRYADFGFFWTARRFHDPFLATNEHEFLRESRRAPSALHVLYYEPVDPKPAPLPLDRYFNGPVEVASMRGSWTDRNAVFVGIKAGYNQVNHGHLDLGNIEVDALGERWFYDIGSDSYALKDFFKMDSTRWTYYRTSSASHNVPMIDGANQDIYATSRITRHEFKAADPFVTVDLTAAYRAAAKRAERGVKLVNGRRGVLIQDEFELTGTHTVSWGVMTDATIAIRGPEAELSQKGKRLRVVLLTPGATFREVSTRQEPPQKTNEGIRRLVFDLAGVTGKQTLAVLMVPAADPSLPVPANRPLAEW